MKNILLSIALLVMGQFAIAQIAEEEAIKNVIISENRAAFNCDASTWKKVNLRADYSFFAVTNFFEPGSAATYKGEKLYDSTVKDLENKNCAKLDVKIEYSDWNIRIYDRVAWATFTEHATMPDATKMNAYTTKILEKHDGQWKIVVISAVWDFNNASKPWNPKEGFKSKN